MTDPSTANPTSIPTDTVISGARIVDGTGNPWYWGDVALQDGRVATIAPAGTLSTGAAELVDGRGHVVCPGFIDIQSHSIVPFMRDGRSLSKITQGITTEIMGEGWTPAPFGGRNPHPIPPDYRPWLGDDAFAKWEDRAKSWTRFGDWLADLENRGVSPNVGSFLALGTTRAHAKGYALGPASPDELAVMREVVVNAMADGAFGVASALVYPPDAYVDTDELAAVCAVVAAHHGVHITHMRSEEARLLEALEETIGIAERTGVATEIYHLKAAGHANWSFMPQVIDRINAARAAGIDVTSDMYPYPASGTGLTLCLPPWSEADGRLWDNLRDPDTRARIRHEMIDSTPEWDSFGVNAGPENVILAGLLKPEHQQFLGRSLAHAAAERGEEWPDTAIELLLAEGQNIFCFYVEMSEENLRLQLRQPWLTISTDAGGVDPSDLPTAGLLHPRSFGTYPRVLGRYVREEGLLTLEEAIRKMTSAVASRLSLHDRGILRPGFWADVVLFDPDTVADHATFADPHQLSTGIRDVWVNGVRVVQSGEHTGALPGRRVHGPAYRLRS